MMKRFASFLVSMVVLFTFTAAIAATGNVTGSGVTNGGSLGKTNATGKLTWTNNTSAGTDKSKGATSADSSGSKSATASILYTGPKGTGSKSDTVNATGLTTATTSAVTAPSASHGYKATSGHAYSSSNYGTWSTGLSKTFN